MECEKSVEYKITGKISEKVIQEILKVKEKQGLTAKAIVDQARKKTSPLHDLFEWDNEKASEMWRFQQARVLINEVKVIIEDNEYYAFENISVQVDDEMPRREYFERSEIMSNESLRKQIVATALEQLLYWKDKYRQYNEFASIIRGIDSFTEKQKAKAVA